MWKSQKVVITDETIKFIWMFTKTVPLRTAIFYIPILCVLAGLLWMKPCRQPYTWDKLSDVNSSSIITIIPQGQILANKPGIETY